MSYELSGIISAELTLVKLVIDVCCLPIASSGTREGAKMAQFLCNYKRDRLFMMFEAYSMRLRCEL